MELISRSMENASASKKAQKQKAKEKAARAKSYELQGPKTLLKNGWFAFALCPIIIIGGIIALWVIASFL